MTKELASSVYLSGKIVEKNIFFFSSRLDALPDGEYHHSVISAYKDGEFFYQERNMQVVSVCIRRETKQEPMRASCVLPRFASVVAFYEKGGREYEEKLPESPHPGSIMSQLREIDETLYAVGFGGAVYKRLSPGNWEILNSGLNIKNISDYQNEGHSFSDAITLQLKNQSRINTINGRNGKIFCAGDNGIIYILRKNQWTPIPSGTNTNLSDIQIDQTGTTYISGWNGIILKGNENEFSIIQTGIDDHFKKICIFNEEVYLGGSKGLYKLEFGNPIKVNFGKNANVNCVELDSYDGQLLLVSDRSFFTFDGKNWRQFDDPDNANISKK